MFAFEESHDTPHFFPEYFPMAKSLTVTFTPLCHSPHEYEEGKSTFCEDDNCTITFNLESDDGGDELQTAVDQLTRFRLLVQRMDSESFFTAYETDFYDSLEEVEEQGKRYWTKPDHVVEWDETLYWELVTWEDMLHNAPHAF